MKSWDMEITQFMVVVIPMVGVGVVSRGSLHQSSSQAGWGLSEMPFQAPLGVPWGLSLSGRLSSSLPISIVSTMFTGSGKRGAGFPSLQRDQVSSCIVPVPGTSVFL